MKVLGFRGMSAVALVGLMALILFPLLAQAKSKKAKAAPPPEAAGVEAEAENYGRDVVHIVREGEELHMLAAYYYGDARQWPKIYQHNRDIIKNPNRIPNGATLYIPVPENWQPYMAYEDFFKRASAGVPPPAPPEAALPPPGEEKKEEKKPETKKPEVKKPEEKKPPEKKPAEPKAAEKKS